jgi:hypothetical protein
VQIGSKFMVANKSKFMSTSLCQFLKVFINALS